MTDPKRLATAAILAVLTVVVAAPPSAAIATALRPRLVLMVSIDQMRFDYLTRFEPLFAGGFKRLLADGAVFSNAHYRHATSETGPGHAVLASGRHGRDTGIVANSWYDRLARKMVNVVDDPAYSPVPGPGRGASPAQFVGSTIGDLLKKVSPGSRVVGVSLKDRSAVLMAGRRGDAAYWYESTSGRFGTSTYYMSVLPAWLEGWNRAGHPDRLNGRQWTRLLPDEAVYRRYAGEDAVPGEWDNKDTVFPHRIRGVPPSEEFYDDLRRTPFADDLTLDVALAAAEAHDLGRDDATDILAVGLSATDVIGHTYGPDSQELMDQILRLDRVLARLIEAMESRAGRGDLLVILSADHAVMPLVENLRARGLDARRVSPKTIEKAVRQALLAKFPGATDLIAAYDEPNFYLDLEAVERRGLGREAVERVIEDALLGTGIVERVYTHARLLGDAADDDPDFSLFRAAFFESRSAHLIARLKRWVYLSDYVGGTGHGTVHDYDRHVPVAFLGSAIKAGRYGQACGPEDIAPTLARLLSLDYPLETGQRLLSEMLPE